MFYFTAFVFVKETIWKWIIYCQMTDTFDRILITNMYLFIHSSTFFTFLGGKNSELICALNVLILSFCSFLLTFKSEIISIGLCFLGFNLLLLPSTSVNGYDLNHSQHSACASSEQVSKSSSLHSLKIICSVTFFPFWLNGEIIV